MSVDTGAKPASWSVKWLADPRLFAVLFVAIVAAMAVIVRAGMDSIQQSEERARQLGQGVLAMQTILRGMAEILVTDGSGASIELTRGAVRSAVELAPLLSAPTGSAGQPAMALAELLKRTAQFVDTPDSERQGDIVAFQIQYGRIARDLSAAAQGMQAAADAAAAERQANRERVQATLAYSLVGLIACLAALFYLFHAMVTRPLRRAVQAVQTFARGDLTARLQGEGHTDAGRMLSALGEMREGLAGIVTSVRQGADRVHSASTHASEVGMGLSQRTEEQSSALEETAATFGEFSATLRDNIGSASEASGVAKEAVRAAESGGAHMSALATTMQDIRASSAKIGDIIGVIDSIAFQTNILALNAAVEAARAGDQGRGFAVVASEVRSLSQKCAAAAKDVKNLIGRSVDTVETGARRADEAGRGIEEVIAAIRKLSNLIDTIAAASVQQSSGIEQIKRAIVDLERVTQQNAAMAEEVAATAEQLKDDATLLVQAVDVIKVVEQAAAPHASTHGKALPVVAVAPSLPARTQRA